MELELKWDSNKIEMKLNNIGMKLEWWISNWFGIELELEWQGIGMKFEWKSNRIEIELEWGWNGVENGIELEWSWNGIGIELAWEWNWNGNEIYKFQVHLAHLLTILENVTIWVKITPSFKIISEKSPSKLQSVISF